MDPSLKITWIKSVSEYLSSSDDHNSSSDVEICCSDGVVPAHRLTLSYISNMLYSAFKFNDAEEDKTVIVLPDFNTSQMSQFLDGVYKCRNFPCDSELEKVIGCHLEKKHLDSKIEVKLEDEDTLICDNEDTNDNCVLDDNDSKPNIIKVCADDAPPVENKSRSTKRVK